MALLVGKVALVTGAARGLGEAIVRRMVAEGATVVAADRRAEDGRAAADAAGVRFAELDVTDADAWQRVVTAVVDDHGRIDVLVNNAGVIRVKPIRECSPEEFRMVVETNLVGTFLGIRAVADHMAAQGGGSIVNLASPGGFEGTYGMPAYTSSKWGIRGLTRTAAVELGGDGIRVNTVVPGPMPTAMTRRPGWTDADYQRHYGSTVPLGRMAAVDEVANLVVWLASDQASYSTGGDFTADGGVTAGKPPPPSPSTAQ
ncbi:MAG TPA: SDR family oxidoreductase [Acidimicrobiales bacterium]|jgi:3alpha(or 20beta)-hydroxysteroid dehydrogenase|nr:SDR family oxidoreductase [Acidimicrobiales bacterium]